MSDPRDPRSRRAPLQRLLGLWKEWDVGLRLAALFLAGVFWFLAQSGEAVRIGRLSPAPLPGPQGPAEPPARNPLAAGQPVTVTATISVPVEIRGLAPGLALAGGPFEVRVTLAGQATTNPPPAKAYVDLSGLGAGQHLVPVQLELPTGFQNLSVEPPQLAVTLDVLATVRQPVRVEVAGLPAGRWVSVLSVDPQEVTVRGARGRLSRLGGIVARVRVPEEENLEGFEQVTALFALDASGLPASGLDIQPPTARVVLASGSGPGPAPAPSAGEAPSSPQEPSPPGERGEAAANQEPAPSPDPMSTTGETPESGPGSPSGALEDETGAR